MVVAGVGVVFAEVGVVFAEVGVPMGTAHGLQTVPTRLRSTPVS
ncbi:hypothetical protein DB30_07638 [Enhygromyxa salina]|uniref:Uncharacterized protein n=1 Tax=Enhygromyxa salina TaxID=215803 RepID=A0A0C2D0X5_9BACT|nr:hypothetical protein DB30_07638 [Enhygromyxa salina]